MAMMQHEAFDGEGIVEEDEEEQLADLPSASASPQMESKFSRKKNRSVYGGFGEAPEPEPEPEAAQPEAPKGGPRRRGSIYNGFDGFGDDEVSEPAPAAATAPNTVDIDGEAYGFGDMDAGGDWG